MCYKNNTIKMQAPVKALITAAALAATVAVADAQAPATRPASQTAASLFLARLKASVDSADRRAVSGMVAYPLTVLASGFNIPVKDAANFVRMYDSFLTPELRCALVESEIPTGAPLSSRRTVVVTPDGLSMVEGAVWAPLKDGRYRIARIRVLPPAPSVEGRKGVERVAFAEPKGERTATFAGWLVRQHVDAYAVAVKRNETLQARIEGFRGHDATVRISTAGKEGTRPPSPPTDIGRTASTTAPADGDYLVEVAHLARYCDPPQRYKLTVTVR